MDSKYQFHISISHIVYERSRLIFNHRQQFHGTLLLLETSRYFHHHEFHWTLLLPNGFELLLLNLDLYYCCSQDFNYHLQIVPKTIETPHYRQIQFDLWGIGLGLDPHGIHILRCSCCHGRRRCRRYRCRLCRLRVLDGDSHVEEAPHVAEDVVDDVTEGVMSSSGGHRLQQCRDETLGEVATRGVEGGSGVVLEPNRARVHQLVPFSKILVEPQL